MYSPYDYLFVPTSVPIFESHYNNINKAQQLKQTGTYQVLQDSIAKLHDMQDFP